MKIILAPVDFSEASINVGSFAAELSKEFLGTSGYSQYTPERSG